MKEHPILFSGEMVRVLLANRKTVTRRLSKSWLKVKAGDLLWVRETIDAVCGCDACYAADDARLVDAHPEKWDVWKFGRDLPYRTIPSIFMPRWASRITLRATEDARMERLQDITEDDAMAEGIQRQILPDLKGNRFHWGDESKDRCPSARRAYKTLWDSLSAKKAPWNRNPEVVRIAFSVQL